VILIWNNPRENQDLRSTIEPMGVRNVAEHTRECAWNSLARVRIDSMKTKLSRVSSIRNGLMPLILAIVCGHAGAGFEICNDSDERVTTAFGYPRDSDWYAEGWWRLDVGECAVVHGGRLGNRYYYYRASGEKGGVWAGDATFCVSQSAFTIRDGPCRGAGQRTERFKRVDIGTRSLDHFTLTLTGRNPSDRGQNFTLDLTPAIQSDPQLTAEIAAICRRVCRGNQKRSWMHAATLNVRPNSTYSTGTIDLRIRNRHSPCCGIIAWSVTENVKIRFRVHNVSCRVTVTRVSASGLIGDFALQLADGLLRLLSNNNATLAGQLGQQRLCP
jgi:uncharacterized membrane protein